MAKKKPVVRIWFVPMKWTYRGEIMVEAATAEEALARAKSADGDLQVETAELVDHDLLGKPELNG